MSMFLGPIHRWLYNKIRIGAGRSQAIEEAFKTAYGGEADALIAGVDENHAAFPVGIDLEDIIGDSPIHPFLSGLIRMVETREGALVKAFTGKFGDEAAEKAISAAAAFGMETGKSAAGEIEPGNMESLYRALYDRQLDGMPCDAGAQPEMAGNTLRIRQPECLHINNWKSVGAPLDVMCKITGAWISGFVEGAAPGLSCRLEGSIIEGKGECLYCISPA